MTEMQKLHPSPAQIQTFRLASTLIHIGSIAVLTTLLLLLSGAVITSYNYFVNKKRASVEQVFSRVWEAIDRRAYALQLYQEHMSQWQSDSPSLTIEAGKVPLVVGDNVYDEYRLIRQNHYDPDMGQFFINSTADFIHKKPKALARLLSVLYILEQSHHKEDFFDNTFIIIAENGEFISSIPHETPSTLVQLLALRDQFHLRTMYGSAWMMVNLDETGQQNRTETRTHLTRVSRIELPEQELAYLVSIQSVQKIGQGFNSKGHYALTEHGQLIYSGPGFDTSLLNTDLPELAPGETALFHSKAKLLVARAFQILPWEMYYTPSAANQFGIEWPIIISHIILYLIGLTLLVLLYRKGKTLVLAPTQQVLTTLLTYHNELTRRNHELSSANEAAIQAMKARSLFLAAMSHEIRTPLNGVMAMLELLGREPLSERQLHAYSLIKNSSDLLLYLIDEILDYTRIQSGKIQFVQEPTQLNSLFNTIAETFRIKVEQSAKPVKLVFKNTVATELVGLIDPFRINQVIGNLLTNALKFTDVGTIRLDCSATEGEPGQVLIRVVDTGIGMTKEQLERIFQPFEQADPALIHKYGGSGLGLAICQGIIEQLGGSISAESLPDLGSVFTVCFPCHFVAASHLSTRLPIVEQLKQDKLQGKVLVVEDHPINQAVLEELLKELNIEMVSVSSAEAALAFLNDNPPPISAILTDISLPGMNGYEFAAALRAQYGTHTPPLVAISAHAFASDIERAKMDGFVDYLTKPISLSKLDTLLNRLGFKTYTADDALQVTPLKHDSQENIFLPIDFTQWREIFGNSPDKLFAALTQFLECDPRDRQALKKALENKDRTKLRMVAHQMAGAAVYLDKNYASCLLDLEKKAETAPFHALVTSTGRAIAYSLYIERTSRDYLRELEADNNAS